MRPGCVGTEGGGGSDSTYYMYGMCWSWDQAGKETDFILLSSGICEILQRWSQKGQKIVGLNEKWASQKRGRSVRGEKNGKWFNSEGTWRALWWGMKGGHNRRHCPRVSGDQIMKILVKQACCACEVLSEKFLFLCFYLISSCLSE